MKKTKHVFNLNNVGKKICKIRGGKYDGKIVCMDKCDPEDNDFQLFKPFVSLTLPDSAFFEPIPPDEVDDHGNVQRTIAYFSAPSGSGKSRLTSEFCNNYKIQFPDNDIYLFSKIKDDSSMKIEKLKKICIDNRLITDPLDIEDFQNSMVIIVIIIKIVIRVLIKVVMCR